MESIANYSANKYSWDEVRLHPYDFSDFENIKFTKRQFDYLQQLKIKCKTVADFIGVQIRLFLRTHNFYL